MKNKVLVYIIFAVVAIILVIFCNNIFGEIGLIILGGVIGIPLNSILEFEGSFKLFIQSIWYGNKDIRVSFAYLYKIKIKNQYLLIMGEKIKKYQPVGGVYQYYSEDIVRQLGFVGNDKMKSDGNNLQDIRGHIKGRKLRKFISWFETNENRECDANREFREELIELNIVDKEIFSKIKYQKIRTEHIGIFKSKYYGLEYKIFDIIELLPSENQKKELEKLFTTKNIKYIYATEEEIKKERKDGISDDHTANITEHSKYII